MDSCLIDIRNGNVRLELVNELNTEIMKKIIKHHIGYNNIIISDGLEAYSQLRYDNYEHRVHIYRHHDLGYGLNQLRKKNKAGKIIGLQSILQYCKDICKMLFYDKDFLIDLDKEMYTKSDSEEGESDDN